MAVCISRFDVHALNVTHLFNAIERIADFRFPPSADFENVCFQDGASMPARRTDGYRLTCLQESFQNHLDLP